MHKLRVSSVSANMHAQVLAHSPAAKHTPSSGRHTFANVLSLIKKTTENSWCTMGTRSDLLNSQLPKSLSHMSGTRLTQLFFFNRWNWSDLFKGPILFRPRFLLKTLKSLKNTAFIPLFSPANFFFIRPFTGSPRERRSQRAESTFGYGGSYPCPLWHH